MELYEFTESISVDSKPFAAGDVIKADAIPRGNLESLIQTKRVKRYVEEKKTDEPKKAESPAPKEPEPKKREEKKTDEPKK